MSVSYGVVIKDTSETETATAVVFLTLTMAVTAEICVINLIPTSITCIEPTTETR